MANDLQLRDAEEDRERKAMVSSVTGSGDDRKRYNLLEGIGETITGIFIKSPATIIGGIVHIVRFILDSCERHYVETNGNKPRPPITKS